MKYRNFFTVGAVLWLSGSTLYSAPSEPKGPIAIETAYEGECPPIRYVADEVDWAAFRASLANVENQAVPNKLDFKFRSQKNSSPAVTRHMDPLIQSRPGMARARLRVTSSFEGTTDDDNAELMGFRVVPPDTNGDVGRDYYAQMNNLVFEVFDKKSGASVLGPLPNTIFWEGTGSVCERFNDGDPIVLFDHEAGRWIFSQFAIFELVESTEQFVSHQCFAVSQTQDPTGAYFLYDFVYSVPTFGGFAALNDYPKIGVWPGGYFISVNEFEIGLPVQFVGASAGVFDRQAMLAGEPAGGVKFILPFTGEAPAHFSLQPSHWEGREKPPKDAGNENIFIQAFDDETWGNGGPDGPDGYFHWALSADFDTDTFSFTPLGFIQSALFDSNLCDFSECIPQPPPAEETDVLDTLSQFTMYRAAYRNFDLEERHDDGDDDSDDDRGHHGKHDRDGDDDHDRDGGEEYETILVSHTVDVDGNDRAGIRWAELRNTGHGFSVYQAGTFAPDPEHRWMGSAAMNKEGDIALGYTVSSEKTFPSVRMAARKKGDPLGLLGEEMDCFAGSGSQVKSFNRWGDYSSMSVDPEDEETFWYTQEYYENSGRFDFKTRVCSFKVR